jgi:hypothetical protein
MAERYWLAKFAGLDRRGDLQRHYVVDGMSGEQAADRLRELPPLVQRKDRRGSDFIQ